MQITTEKLEKLTSGLLSQLSRDKLGAVDELGEVGVGLVRKAQAGQRPLLWVHLPTDLHVDHFHFLTVLQSLRQKTMSYLVCATTEKQSHPCIQTVTNTEGHELMYVLLAFKTVRDKDFSF